MIMYRDIDIANGESKVKYRIYKCNCCGADVEEAFPMYKDNENVYCIDCAYKKGKITEKEYLNEMCMDMVNARVLISPEDEVVICIGKAPWEMSNKDYRKTPEYKKWRMKVFQRDNFTCQICGQVGGKLNAHHIKSFAKYKKLRTVVSNGITLCEKCHKQLHKEMRA